MLILSYIEMCTVYVIGNMLRVGDRLLIYICSHYRKQSIQHFDFRVEMAMKHDKAIATKY